MRMLNRCIAVAGVFLQTSMSLAQLGLSNLQVHGFVSQGYMKTSDNNYLTMMTRNGSFEFNEAAVNFSFTLGPKLHGGIQLFSKDLGREGNHNIILDWGYGDYRWRDFLGIRLGRIKTPRGLYNEIRDIDVLRPTVLLPQSVYNEGIKDPAFAYQGGGLYGYVSIGALGDLAYDAFAGTFNVPDPNGGYWDNNFRNMMQGALRSGEFPAQPNATIRNPFIRGNRLYGGALKWETPLEGLRFGGSILYADVDVEAELELIIPIQAISIIRVMPMHTDVQIKNHIVGSCEYKNQRLTLAAEYQYEERHIREPEHMISIRADFKGWYTLGAYRITDYLTLAGYYSVSEDDDDSIVQQPAYYGWLRDTALGLNFRLTSSWIMKVEGHYMDGGYHLGVRENPDGFEQYWYLLAVKTSFHF